MSTPVVNPRLRMGRRGALILAGAAALQGPSSRASANGGCFRLKDGRRLEHRQSGDPSGAAVFYFHGMPGSRLESSLIEQEAAAAGVWLISLNRPGIGRSDMQPHRRVLDWPDDVRQVADALGVCRFSVIGVSGGAPYALACAARLPSRVCRVAILSGHAPFGHHLERGNQDALVQIVGACKGLGATAFALMRRKLDRDPDGLLQTLSGGWTDADRQLVLCNPDNRAKFLRNIGEALCQPCGLAHDIRLLAKRWGFDICQSRCAGVALWHGACDEVVPQEQARFLHRRIPGSQLVVNPCTSHVTSVKHYALDVLRFAAGG